MFSLSFVFKQTKQIILDIFFPIFCLNCKKDGERLCKDCFNKLKLDNNLKEIFDLKPSNLDGFFVAADWQDKILQKLIHNYKYNFSQDLAESLSLLLMIKFNKMLKFYPELKDFVLMPIPLHVKRLNWRGFNQSELLANNLAKNLSLAVNNNLLIRIKNTRPQVGLDGLGRAKNITNAFKIGDTPAPAQIILIDDVLTTGATMNESARILKQNGAKMVYGLSIARG